MSKKLAYVTGGMGGIGTAICQRLSKDGFIVVAGCGPKRDYQAWLDEQAEQGFQFYASVGNVADWDSTTQAFEQVKKQFGPISVLVNNAGITRDGLFRKMSRSEERRVGKEWGWWGAPGQVKEKGWRGQRLGGLG